MDIGKNDLLKNTLKLGAAAAAVIFLCAAVFVLMSGTAYADCMEPGEDVPEEEFGCTSEVGYRITPDMIPDHA